MLLIRFVFQLFFRSFRVLTTRLAALRVVKRINLRVYAIGLSLIVGTVLALTWGTKAKGEVLQASLTAFFSQTDVFFTAGTALIVLAIPVIALSDWGKLRLGGEHDRPEYSLVSWASMLFSCGMGVGILFFGVCEPLSHYAQPASGEAFSSLSRQMALPMTFFHWGLHAWAIYAVMGLLLAYGAYKKEQPLRIKSVLYPLLGEKIHGVAGDLIDALALVCTVLAMATSLGLGAQQFCSGLTLTTGLALTNTEQVLILFLIGAASGACTMSGLKRGIEPLSRVNTRLALMFIAALLLLGPSLAIFRSLLQSTGVYLAGWLQESFNVYAEQEAHRAWFVHWRLFYWAWWLAFSPFVGLFIAKISKGRTIGEFLLGAVLLPTALTLTAMGILGASSLEALTQNGASELLTLALNEPAAALFVFLEGFKGATLLQAASLVMIVLFLLTSMDSASFVADALSQHSQDKRTVIPREPVNTNRAGFRLFWCALTTWVSFYVGQGCGLDALKTLTLGAAVPFLGLILLGLAGLIRDLLRLSEDQSALSVQSDTGS